MPVAAIPPAKVLKFRAGGRQHELAAGMVSEVVRMPRIARVPHAPPALLGLANLRGAVVPVVSAARLLELPERPETRVIVVEAGEPVGLAVEAISEMAESGDGARMLDLAALLPRGAGRAAKRRRGHGGETAAPLAATQVEEVAFVSFAVAGQDFALPLAAVDEVLALPETVTLMPHAEEVVIGSTAWRGAILPLLSLRALLALPAGPLEEAARVVVVRIGAQRVGLAVDALGAILRVAERAIDAVPHALARGNAEARIQAICRLDDGRRLVSVLAADQLLRDDITARLLQGRSEESAPMAEEEADEATEQFVLFRVGEEEFALPIAAVEEVAALPAKLARLPKAPAFVKGVINLHGQVIPLIDQNQRFGSASGDGRRRVIVVRLDELRAGFIVDHVSEVVRLPAGAIGAAPAFGNDDTQVFERVAALPDQDRIVLIVSPRELLDRAERDLLRALGAKEAAAGS